VDLSMVNVLPIADAIDNQGLRAKKFGGRSDSETQTKAFEVSSLGLKFVSMES